MRESSALYWPMVISMVVLSVSVNLCLAPGGPSPFLLTCERMWSAWMLGLLVAAVVEAPKALRTSVVERLAILNSSATTPPL